MTTTQEIGIDSFLEAIDDPQLERRVRDRDFTSLDETFRYCLKLEAFDKAISMRVDPKREPIHSARAVQSNQTLQQIQLQLNEIIQKVESQNKEIKAELLANKLHNETRIKEVVETMCRETNMPGVNVANETFQEPNQTRYRSNVRCYNCNRFGHISRECRAPRRPRVNDIQNNGNENSVMNSNPINNSNESHRVGVIFDTVDPAQEVYIQMKIGDENICCLLDSGCQISILPHSLVRGEVLYASSKRMKAANDIEIPVLGEIEINLELGPLILPTRFLVSDHVTEVMLGFDFLKSNKIQWNFDSDELSIQGIDFKLCTAVNSGWHLRVVLETDVRIPSNCEIDVPASVLVRRISVAEAWMTEATEIQSGLCSVRSLVSNKGLDAIPRKTPIRDVKRRPKPDTSVKSETKFKPGQFVFSTPRKKSWITFPNGVQIEEIFDREPDKITKEQENNEIVNIELLNENDDESSDANKIPGAALNPMVPSLRGRCRPDKPLFAWPVLMTA